jgi:hypothetical protein
MGIVLVAFLAARSLRGRKKFVASESEARIRKRSVVLSVRLSHADIFSSLRVE